jgi:hypothetical protein
MAGKDHICSNCGIFIEDRHVLLKGRCLGQISSHVKTLQQSLSLALIEDESVQRAISPSKVELLKADPAFEEKLAEIEKLATEAIQVKASYAGSPFSTQASTNRFSWQLSLWPTTLRPKKRR